MKGRNLGGAGETIKFGHTGLDVFRICLGRMSYGVPDRDGHPGRGKSQELVLLLCLRNMALDSPGEAQTVAVAHCFDHLVMLEHRLLYALPALPL